MAGLSHWGSGEPCAVIEAVRVLMAGLPIVRCAQRALSVARMLRCESVRVALIVRPGGGG